MVLAGRCYDDVILHGFGQPEEIQSCLEDCKKLGAKFVEHHGADLSDPSQIEACFKYVEDKCGRGPDVLVSCMFLQLREQWDKVLSINLSAAFHTTRLAVKGMKERGWGRIINISSVHGLVGSVNKSAYVAARHGIIGLTKVHNYNNIFMDARHGEPLLGAHDPSLYADNAEKIVAHQLLWRSEFINQFIQKLDSRYEKARKPGTGSTVKRERVNGLPSTSNPPPSLPSWMIDPSYKMQATTTVCISPPPMEGQDPPTVPEEVTTYTTLIADVQDVHDESSDFELPDTVVA